jgi:hypothetical protein
MSNAAEDNTPPEVALGRLTVAAARLLEREMDGVFHALLRNAWHGPDSPIFPMAQLANRIVVMCRNLVEDIEAYEVAAAWESDTDTSHDLPF